MTSHKVSYQTPTLALILASVITIAIGVTVPSDVNAAKKPDKILTSKEKIDVRMAVENEKKNCKQSMKISKHYKELAKRAKKEGNNADAQLLDKAAEDLQNCDRKEKKPKKDK